MSMKVLKSKQQIQEARDAMVADKLSATPSPFEAAVKHLVKRTRLVEPLLLGDFLKSWDVLETIRFCESNLKKDAPILDIGAYASEVIVSLHKAGFTNLTGIDLNPLLKNMPHRDKISYVTGNFMATPFEDASFQAITSISVIEHGLDAPKLLGEAGRILQPGGYFIASFDYWPEKIDTGNTRFFDMDWLIFSKEDVAALIEEGRRHGLEPAGELRFEGGDKAIHHGGYDYTFGWLALQKRA